MAAIVAKTESGTILVKNVPPKATCDKLVIHFQRKKHGGCGDVTSITYPKSSSEINQAVIEFESSATLHSVLRHSPHVLLGSQLDVSEFPTQCFGKCSVVVSKAAMQKLQSMPFEFKSIIESTGVQFYVKNGNHKLKGHWYQVAAAAEGIEDLLRTHVVNNSSKTVPTSKSGHTSLLARPPDTVPEKKSGNRSLLCNSSQDVDKGIHQEIAFDENIQQYFFHCHPDWQNPIKKLKVTVRILDKKIVVSTTDNTKQNVVREATEKLRAMYRRFSATVKNHQLDLKNVTRNDNEDIDEAIIVTNKTHKNVFVGKRSKSLVEFLAMSNEDAQEAMKTFQSLFPPDENHEIARFSVTASSMKLQVVHGDFRKAKTDAMISEIDPTLKHGRVLACFGHNVRDIILDGVQRHKFFVSPTYGALQCKNLINYHHNTDFKNVVPWNVDDFRTVASMDITTVTLPVFWPYHYSYKGKVTVDDYKDICASISEFAKQAARFVKSRNMKIPSDLHLMFSNLKEAEKFVEVAEISGDLEKETGNSSKKDEDQEEACAICLDELSGAVGMKTLPCNHSFHQACIDRAFSVAKKCPMCMRYYGEPKGTQPKNATMMTRITYHRLPGYSCDTIVIHYNIPSGIQGPEHPNPGHQYHGTTRDAYLPNNAEGRELLLLLRKAFDARLTFRIGRSVTTGRDNCVTWNDIHHKTSMSGGATGFGYPDPTYLSRLRMELADKGIRPDGN